MACLRQLGLRLIIYLDDILILAQSKELAKLHASTTIYLGFLVNFKKLVLIQATEMEFLSFVVNSLNLTLALPRDKIRKIKKECQRIIDSPQITIRQLAKLLGFLTSTIQAVFPAPLHFRQLQEVKKQGVLSQPGLRLPSATLPSGIRRTHLVERQLGSSERQESCFRNPRPDNRNRCISQGLRCLLHGGIHRRSMAEGESQLHINCLELVARAFAIKTFAKGKVQMKVCLLMDNMTPAHYINKMGWGGGGVYKISHPSSTGSRLMELVPSTPDPYRDTTHHRSSECPSGQR